MKAVVAAFNQEKALVALVGTPWSTQASSVMMQGTYTGLQPLTRPHLPELDLWYTAQTVALLEVRKIFG